MKNPTEFFLSDFLVKSGHAAGTVIVLRPVTGGQVGVGNSGTGIGGVDKLSVSGVDTHMGDAAGVCIGEEHDVANFQVTLGNRSALLVLFSGSPVRGEAQLLENIVDKAGAVKAGGRSTAGHIGSAQILLGFCQNLCAGDIDGGRSGAAGGSVQGSGTGGDAGGFAAAVEPGRLGGISVFVGDLRQIHKVTADVTDGVVVDYLVPAIIQAQNVAFAVLGGNGHAAVRGAGTGTDVDTAAIDFAVAQFGIFTGQNIQVILVHVTFLKIVVDLVPVAVLADDHNAIVFKCLIQDGGAGVGITAQTQIIGIYKSNAIHHIAGCKCRNCKAADKQHERQNQRKESFGKSHSCLHVYGVFLLFQTNVIRL